MYLLIRASLPDVLAGCRPALKLFKFLPPAPFKRVMAIVMRLAIPKLMPC